MPGDPGSSIDFCFDGRPMTGRVGQSVAIALWDAGIRTLRRSAVDGGPRGMFCAIGICQECVVEIGDVRRPACTTLVRAGMDVRSILDLPSGRER